MTPVSTPKHRRTPRGFKAEAFGLASFDLEMVALQVYVNRLGSAPREQCANHLSALIIITLSLIDHLDGSDKADALLQRVFAMWMGQQPLAGDSETVQ